MTLSEESDKPVIVAVINKGDDLVTALRKRMAAFNISHEALDEISGVSPGYSSKVLAWPPIRGFGPMSFWSIAGALGVNIALVEDKTKKTRTPPKPQSRKVSSRHWRFVEAHAKAVGTIQKEAKKYGSTGGRKRFEMMSAEEKKNHQSRAAKARWRAYRRDLRERIQASALLASTSSGQKGRVRKRGSTK